MKNNEATRQATNTHEIRGRWGHWCRTRRASWHESYVIVVVRDALVVLHRSLHLEGGESRCSVWPAGTTWQPSGRYMISFRISRWPANERGAKAHPMRIDCTRSRRLSPEYSSMVRSVANCFWKYQDNKTFAREMFRPNLAVE